MATDSIKQLVLSEIDAFLLETGWTARRLCLRAGVSQTAVSRFLRDASTLRLATADRLRETMREVLAEHRARQEACRARPEFSTGEGAGPNA